MCRWEWLRQQEVGIYDEGAISSGEGEKNENLGGGGLLGLAGKIIGQSWKNYFAIVVSSKAFSSMGEEVDEQIIRDSDMPHWMDLDTLYLFTAENDKDESEFKEKISATQLTFIEPVKGENIKGNFSFLVETKEKYGFYGVKYCKEMNRWVASLRKIKQTVEEISRTKNQILNKNIDPLIILYKKKVAYTKLEIRSGTEKVHPRIGLSYKQGRYEKNRPR